MRFLFKVVGTDKIIFLFKLLKGTIQLPTAIQLEVIYSRLTKIPIFQVNRTQGFPMQLSTKNVTC